MIGDDNPPELGPYLGISADTRISDLDDNVVASGKRAVEQMLGKDFTAVPTQRDPDAAKTADAARVAARIQDAEADKAEQANRLRTRFFYFGVIAASATVIASVAVVIICAIWGQKVSDVVATAFIGSLTVEAIGITKIMAGYLFPPPTKDTGGHS